MSTVTNPANPQSSSFETAEIRVVSRHRRVQSEYKLSYVLLSLRFYWKEANKDGTNIPQSFLDFQNSNSLELVRLEADKTWNDVDEYVKVDDYNGRQRITVCGRPHGRTRSHHSLRRRTVEVEIIPNAPEHVEIWLNQLRALIMPWKVMRHEFKAVANLAPSGAVEEMKKTLDGFVNGRIGTELSSFSTNRAQGKWTDNMGSIPEQMEKARFADDLIAHCTAAAETCAALVKLMAEHLGDTAEFAGNVAKGVAGVSTAFHLVSLGAKGVSMCAEASRGRRVLPVLLRELMSLLQYTIDSIVKIMKLSASVNQIDDEFVFDLFKRVTSAVDKAEAQLFRGKVHQIINAGSVQELEKEVEDLKHQVVTAGNTLKICAFNEKMNLSEDNRQVQNEVPHHVLPRLSPFFSGRSRELARLRDMLEKFGSAVISQCGGYGKTELMVALADRAEQDGLVPGGTFWVTVEGDEKDVIGSLAGLAENLMQGKLNEQQRRNPNLVMAWLKKGLSKREGRWLLCLDNADDSRLSGILNEVCGIAGETQGKGWVVVTSRLGRPDIWSEMTGEQKLDLQPLCTEDAMVALWRQIHKITTNVEDDDGVMKAINKLKKEDITEYRALKQLCGNEGNRSLGGLPLAMVQAGTYMARHEISITEYWNLFKTTHRKEDMQHLMKDTAEVKSIRPEQKSIWTTWKISVGKLSDKAYSILRAMAMLGPYGVGEGILRGIVKRVMEDEEGHFDIMFRRVVIEELAHGSSLICRDTRERESQESRIYKMHGLVRLFVVSDMNRGSQLWNDSFNIASVTVHQIVMNYFERSQFLFHELPDVLESNHYELEPHTTSLVDHYVLPTQGAEIRHLNQVFDIHRYSARVMDFKGKSKEESSVWDRLLKILLLHQNSNRRQNCNERSFGTEEERYRVVYVYNSLGTALVRNGKHAAAISAFEKTIEILQTMHASETAHLQIASTLCNLASVHQIVGKHGKALGNFETSLKMFLEIFGDDKLHPEIAKLFVNIGYVYCEMGKTDKAVETLEKGLKILRSIYGCNKNIPTIADCLNNLGISYSSLGQLKNAARMFLSALEMRYEIYGRDSIHPDIAVALDNLGSVYKMSGKLDLALKMHRKSMNMSQEIHGHDKPHRDIAMSLNNIGIVHEAMGNLDEALKNHELCLKMNRAIYGNEKVHPNIAKALSNIGGVHRSLKNLKEALKMYELSLNMRVMVHGRDNPHLATARCLTDLGITYMLMDKLPKALESYNQSLEMYRAIHGHGKVHKDIAETLIHIGHIYCIQEKWNEAAQFLEQSLEMFRTVHAQNLRHPHITQVLKELRVVHEKQGKKDKALAKQEQYEK